MTTINADPSYTGDHVQVDADAASGAVTAMLPETVEGDEDVAASVFEMTPAEAVELAAGILASLAGANELNRTRRLELERRHIAALDIIQEWTLSPLHESGCLALLPDFDQHDCSCTVYRIKGRLNGLLG